MWKGRLASVGYFKVFGSKCYIKASDDNLGKFNSRFDKGIFLGYSISKKAYECYNMRLKRIVESVDVKVDEELPKYSKELRKIEVEDTVNQEEQSVKDEVENQN